MSLIKTEDRAFKWIKWGIIILLLALPFTPRIYNNVLVWDFTQEYKSEVSHPPGTERILLDNDVGVLLGNGDHCDFVLYEIRSHKNVSIENIEKFYKDKFMKVKTRSGVEDARISVYSSERFKSFTWDKKGQELLNKAHNLNDDQLYVINIGFVYSDVIFPFIDFRCI